MEQTKEETPAYQKTRSPYCELNDADLIKKAKEWIQSLIKTGGRSWCLPVPANPDADVDLILSEVVERFNKAATMYTHSEVQAIAEAVKEACTKRIYSCGVYTSIEDSIKLLDVNQFIPKKG